MADQSTQDTPKRRPGRPRKAASAPKQEPTRDNVEKREQPEQGNPIDPTTGEYVNR